MELIPQLNSKNTSTTKSDNTGIQPGVFWLRNMPVLLGIVARFMSSIIVLAKSVSFWIVPVLHTVSDITIIIIIIQYLQACKFCFYKDFSV